jgi:hypothetical protein
VITWLRLKWLEHKLVFGEFGKNTKYRRFCLERNATTNGAKLQIAREVVDGRWVGIAECWTHAVYLREHENRKA